MNHSDIAALMRGAAQPIHDLVVGMVLPLQNRIDELERELAAVDHTVAIRAAVADAIAALPSPADGKDVDMDAVRSMIADAVGALQVPKDGESVDMAEVERMVREAVAALPIPSNGKDADPVEIGRMVLAAVTALPAPRDGKDVDRAEVERMVAEATERVLSGWERPADGRSVTLDDVTPLIEARVAEAVAALPVPVAPTAAEVAALVLADAEAAARAAVDGWARPQDGKSVDMDEVRALVSEAVASLPPAPAGRDADPAEVERLIADHVERAVAALPAPKDGEPGKDVDQAEVARMVSEAVAALPPAPAGRDADPEVTAELVRSTVAEAVAALPAPKDGVSVTVDDVAPLIDETVARYVAALPPAEPGKDGDPGKLPIVRAWTDDVTYEGDVRTHNGATWQALKDTAKEPPHADWTCLAAAGSNGADGRSFKIRDTYVEGADYRELDVVVLDGGSFAAKRDDPGPCPGDGWKMIARQGKPGRPGDPGKKGDPGPVVTASLRGGSIDDGGILTLLNADGTEVEVDLYPVLSKIGG